MIPDNVQNQKAKQLSLFKERVQNHPTIKLEQPCQCGSSSAKLGAGRKPQEASLHCSECKRFIRWVGTTELRALLGRRGKIHIEQPDGSSITIDRCRRTLEYSFQKGGEQ